jgi:hypothetical protein
MMVIEEQGPYVAPEPFNRPQPILMPYEKMYRRRQISGPPQKLKQAQAGGLVQQRNCCPL